MTATSVMPVTASRDINVVFGEHYNSYITNRKPSIGEYVGKNVHVVERVEGKDKAVCFDLDDGYAAAEFPVSTDIKKFAVSADIKLCETISEFSFSIKDGSGSWLRLYNINESGYGFAYNGYRVSGIPMNNYTNITILFNGDKKQYSIYIGGRCVLGNWSLPRTSKLISPQGLKLEFISEKINTETAAEVYVDNVYVYESSCFIDSSKLLKGSYNSDSVEFKPDDEDENVNIYLDASFDKKHAGLSYTPKDNSIKIINDSKTNNSYLALKRTSSTDSYINLNLHPVSNSIVLEFDVMYIGNFWNGLVSMYDTNNISGTLISYSNGNILITSTGAVVGKIARGKWAKLSIVYNCKSGKFDLYLNGEIVAKRQNPTKSGIRSISTFRIYFGTGSLEADMYLDNIRIYDGKNPISDLSVLNSLSKSNWSVLNYASLAETALGSGISLHEDSDYIYYGKMRRKLQHKSYLQNGELMISLDAVNNSTGKNIEYDESTGEIIVGKEIVLKVGADTAIINGHNHKLNAIPEVKENTVYVSVKDIYMELHLAWLLQLVTEDYI